MTELLIHAGNVVRTYTVDPPDQIWREHFGPLVARLLDHPEDRAYHGLVGLPYWEASLSLPPGLAHPDLAGTYLCFYNSPTANHPYYVGAIAATDRTLDQDAMLISVLSGAPVDSASSIINAAKLPALIGTYWIAAWPVPEASVRSSGECAAKLVAMFLG